jgi:hypothetical protein
MIDALVFSRNRPMQLHCLLESIKRNTNLSKIKVLHRYDARYSDGLKLVQSANPGVEFLEEANFEVQVKSFLQGEEKYCTFFVDDIVVKDRIDFAQVCSVLESNHQLLTFSLRLGTHLTRCYPNNAEQQVPNGSINSGFFVWGWKGASHDWGYPLSVDGHVFRRSELEGWCNHLKFKNPNQFEASMQTIPSTFALQDHCVSYVISKIVNTPINRVQEEFKNRSEEVSIDSLYDSWMNGERLQFEKIFKLTNDGAHMPVEIPRGLRE